VWVDYNWTGTVSTAKKDYTFEPNSIPYNSVLADDMDQNYVANNIYDLDCDGSIGMADLAIILQNWLAAGPDIAGNFNRDEILDFLDFAVFHSDGSTALGVFDGKHMKPACGQFFGLSC